MSIFDKLKKGAADAVKTAAQGAANAIGKQEETFVFKALPESLAELQALPEASLDSPFKTAALTVCAICAYAADPEIGKEMLNWLRGPRPLGNTDISFLNDRFRDGKTYVPFSYFKGAKPDNDYTPAEPFTLTVFTNPYSAANEGYMKLFLESGGADNPREIVLRKRESDGKWFLWEQFILVGIRDPKSADPWA
ncbi:MAG: hypothetical protein E7655_01805 [Ruminococcaceae bacterium]|nr:hypothetical protein [Oscillospiraceae bacterium]